MACFHRMPAWRAGVGISLSKRESAPDYLLPCGSCIGCRTARAKEWAVRCALEESVHVVSSFVTLTYGDRYVPPTLSREAVSGFVKRLRSASVRFRYFASGEYGEQNGRPHYHALLFGVPPESDDVHAAWRRWLCGQRHVHTESCGSEPLGHVRCDVVNAARIAYTAGYCAKKIGQFPDPPGGYRVDADTGECFRFVPPFVQMSRRPGIGSWAREYWRDFRSVATANGVSVAVPRFLHAAWKDNASEEEKLTLEEEKFSKSLDALRAGKVGEYYNRAGETIAWSRHNLLAERRAL